MLATFRQDRFVSEYLVDLNATRAAIRAGYSEHTADVQASRLLRNVQVKTAILAKQQETEQRLQLQRDDIIKGLVLVANKAKELGDPSASIAAWREIGRLMGYYSQQLTNDISSEGLRVEDMSEKELLALAGQCGINLDNIDSEDWIIS